MTTELFRTKPLLIVFSGHFWADASVDLRGEAVVVEEQSNLNTPPES